MLFNKIIASIFACCLLTSSVLAQEYGINDVVEPESFTFRGIPTDSIEAIQEKDVLSGMTHADTRYHMYDEGRVLRIGTEIYIAVRKRKLWLISDKPVWGDLYGAHYELSETRLDWENEERSAGAGKLLFSVTYNHNRSFQYTSYTINATAYSLIDVFNGYLFRLGESKYEEYNNSRGYANADEEDEEYITRSHNVFDLRIVQGKVVYENIDCSDCAWNEKGDVFALEYNYKNDTLYKGELLFDFKNELSEFGYKVLRGKVGRHPVTMHLTGTDKVYWGYYYYDKDDKAIELVNAAYGDTTGAQLVLKEREGGGTYFRGEVNGNVISGKWTDGKKSRNFSLKEDYSSGAVPLKAYSFSDSVVDDKGNSYDIDYSWYVVDTASNNKDDMKNARAHFHDFRDEYMDLAAGNLFDHAEDANYYSSESMTETYNRKGLLSLETHFEEYLGGARVGHMWSAAVYDIANKKQVNVHDMLSCSDSVLRSVIEEVYLENNKDTLEKHLIMLGEFYTGQMTIRPGSFAFFFDAYPFTYSVVVPLGRLEKYIRSEYRNRLMPR